MLTEFQNGAFAVAASIVAGGRGMLFETATSSLPVALSDVIREDDLIPQFGFIGSGYSAGGLLIVGINPGNGGRVTRSPSDARMMPILHSFHDAPDVESFEAAMNAQMQAFPDWPASAEIGPTFSACGIELGELAYLNASPYRAGAGGASDVFPTKQRRQLAARVWVGPMIQALRPGVIVAHGVTASKVLRLASPDVQPLVFNRVRIKAHRDQANVDFAKSLAGNLVPKVGPTP